jgi:hypothetical protein
LNAIQLLLFSDELFGPLEHQDSIHEIAVAELVSVLPLIAVLVGLRQNDVEEILVLPDRR